MATVELAAALPVLVLLLAVGLGALDAARLRIVCVDAAREGARVAARADDAAGTESAQRVAPAGSAIAINRANGAVIVQVTARGAVLGARISPMVITATATAMIEPDSSDAAAGRRAVGRTTAPP